MLRVRPSTTVPLRVSQAELRRIRSHSADALAAATRSHSLSLARRRGRGLGDGVATLYLSGASGKNMDEISLRSWGVCKSSSQ